MDQGLGEQGELSDPVGGSLKILTIIKQQQVVDDFSSKLDLSRQFETVEGIDTDHMQMAKCRDKSDEQYRKIVGVLKQFIRKEARAGGGTQVELSTATGAETQTKLADQIQRPLSSVV